MAVMEPGREHLAERAEAERAEQTALLGQQQAQQEPQIEVAAEVAVALLKMAQQPVLAAREAPAS